MATLRNYSVVHRSPIGVFKALIGDSYTIKWVLRLNKPGTLTLELPSAYCSSVVAGYELTDFEEDDQFQLWRSYGTGFNKSLVGYAPFHLNKVEARRRDDGRRTVYIEAQTPLSFLDRRINPYDGDDARSDFDNNVLACDDLAKLLIRNNYSAAAGSYVANPDPVRDLSAYLQVQADAGAVAPAIPYTGKAENANILSEIQKVADYAASQNISMFFDVVQVTDNPYLLEFRTFTPQRGIDRTQATGGVNAFTVVDNVNVADYSLTFDWTESLTRVYAGANGGTGGGRDYETATDPGLGAQLLVNPFALREDYTSSTSEDPDAILVDAQAELANRQRVFQATGLLAENLVTLYGRDFDFGDRVSVYLENLAFEAHIDAESGTLSDRGENLEIGFNTEPTRRRSSGGLGTILADLGWQKKQINYLRRREHI